MSCENHKATRRPKLFLNEIDVHFLKGVELFNGGAFFEAHEEMEEAMNRLEDDTSDWEFYLGCCAPQSRITNSNRAKYRAPNCICARR